MTTALAIEDLRAHIGRRLSGADVIHPGPANLLRLALGRLSVADLERRATQMVGTGVQAVPVRWPEIAFDVDDADDLTLARQYLRRRQAEGA